jgi:hypothetical protein
LHRCNKAFSMYIKRLTIQSKITLPASPALDPTGTTSPAGPKIHSGTQHKDFGENPKASPVLL